MSFKTKGQEFVAKAGATATVIAIYMVAILGCLYLIKYCGPEHEEHECVCNCGTAEAVGQ